MTSGVEREAGIRISVRKDGAIQQIRDLDREASRMQANLRGGLEASQRAATGLVASLRQGAATAASFFGIHAGIGLVRDAMQIQKTFERIGFTMEAGTGTMRSWRAAMADVWGVNRRWGQDVNALSSAYENLFEEVGGGAGQVTSLLDKVAKAATASGRPVAQLADLGATLAEKWEIPADKIDDTFRSILSLTGQGGVRLDEFLGQASRLGPKIRKAGLTGSPESIANLLGFMNRGEQALSTPRQGAMAVGGLIELLSGDSTEKVQQLRKAGVAGHLIKGNQAIKDPFAMMREIVAATGGDRSKIEAGFGKSSPMSDILGELARPFREAVDELPKNATPAQKRAAGLDAYDRAVEESRRVLMSKTRYEEIAAERSKSTEAETERAMASLKSTMTSPEFLNAVNKSAKALAGLADWASKIAGSPTGKLVGDVVDKAGPGGILAGYVGLKGAGSLFGKWFAGGAGAAAGGAGKALVGAGAKGAGVGAVGMGAAGLLGLVGMALTMEGDGYNPEATLAQKEKALKKYRSIDSYGEGSRRYEIMRSIERSPEGKYAYRKKIMDETGALLDIQQMRPEDWARYTPHFAEGARGASGGLERPGAAVDAAGLGDTVHGRAARRGRSPLQEIALGLAPASAAGLGPLAGLAMASRVATMNQQAEDRARYTDTRGAPAPAGAALDTLPSAIANPIVRALVQMQTGVLRVEVVNGGPRLTPSRGPAGPPSPTGGGGGAP